MFKFFAVAALLAAASASPAGQATSFVSFNDNHNSVNHIQSAPAAPKYAAAPAAPAYYAQPAAAPKYAAPAYYSQAAAAPKYAAPVAVKVALPAAPAPAPAYYAAPAPQKYAVAPVAAKVAVPVTKYQAAAPAYVQKEEYAPAHYEFAYLIEDPHTGDYHSQQEKRDGDHVVGQYSLHEADGTIRLVKYSDDGHGFNAVVEKQGEPVAAAPAYKKVAPVPAPKYY